MAKNCPKFGYIADDFVDCEFCTGCDSAKEIPNDDESSD